MGEDEPFRQPRHPEPVLCADPAGGEGVPFGGQRVADGAFLKPAAAIVGAFSKLFLAISRDHRTAPAAHHRHRFGGRTAIGGDVARADGVPGGDAAPRSLRH